jgi:hypothetical protein
MNDQGFIWLLVTLSIWLIAAAFFMGDYSYVWHR